MAPPTPTPAPNGTNATPEHRPPPALPPDPSEADIQLVTAIGFVAGTLPAARAANADPVNSLRYE